MENKITITTAEAIRAMESAEIAHTNAARTYSDARDALHEAIKHGTDAEKAAASDAAEAAAATSKR